MAACAPTIVESGNGARIFLICGHLLLPVPRAHQPFTAQGLIHPYKKREREDSLSFIYNGSPLSLPFSTLSHTHTHTFNDPTSFVLDVV